MAPVCPEIGSRIMEYFEDKILTVLEDIAKSLRVLSGRERIDVDYYDWLDRKDAPFSDGTDE